jgi:serine O-acetyltransferase
VSRHRGLTDPAVWPLLVYRFGRRASALPGPLSRVGSRVYGALSLAVEVATGTRLHRETQVGEGLHFIHSGNVKIHPEAVLGARVGIMHDVTIGLRHGMDGAPQIGDDVLIGAGAKILGPVRIGDRAVIAANSLVITDIAADVTAMGVPARALPKKKKPALQS